MKCHCEAEGRGNPVNNATITGLPRGFASRNDIVFTKMDEKKLIQNLNTLKNIKPREEWKTFQREILVKQINGSVEGANLLEAPVSLLTPSLKWLQYITQPVMAVLLIVAILIGGGSMSVWASKNSVPGDSLYIAKIINEKTQFALTFNEEKKARLGLEYAGNRAKELKEVLLTEDSNEDKGVQVEKLVNNFKKEVNNAKDRIAKINSDNQELPITTTEIIETEKEENVDTAVFSANLGKDENGIEISDSASSLQADSVDLVDSASSPQADSESDLSTEAVKGEEEGSTTSEEILNINAETAPASSSSETVLDPEQTILEAQTLLDLQDFDGTLSKLEEAGALIDQVGQPVEQNISDEDGEVKGTSTSAVIEDDPSASSGQGGKVLGVEEKATSSDELN
jgi:hypothetical protein